MDAVLHTLHTLVSRRGRNSQRRRSRRTAHTARSYLRLLGERLEGRELFSADPVSQWASKVVAFSSQYDTAGYSAAQTLGAPDVTSYGDNHGAWAPRSKDGTTETITVGFTTSVYASGINVRETCGNGFVTKLEVRNAATGVYETVWSGTDSTAQGAPGDLKVSFAQRSYLVDAVRVTTNTSHSTTWEEIDAIQLTGTTTPSTTTVTAAFQDGVNSYAGTTDTYLRSATATTNYGAASTNYSSSVSGALLRWDLSTIPTNAVVQSATLTLNVTDASKSSYELYQLKRNWSESSATWNNASTGTPWQVAGAKGANDRGTTVLGAITATTTGAKTITLNAAGLAAVQAWIQNPSANFGLTLQDYTGTDSLAFQSSESGTVAARPKLEITYTVSTVANQAPSVTAGADKTVASSSAVSLDGTVSDDGLPNPPATVTTTWSQVSGPGSVAFANSAAVDTTATFSTAGTYVLKLTASDGALVASDEITITVTAPVNTAPVVSAGANQTITLPGTVTLLGTVTDDGKPNPPAATTVTWSTVSGPSGGTVTFANANSASTTASFSTAGTYVLKLTASDGQLSSSATTTVTVNTATPVGTSKGLWISKEEVMALPTSGAAWDSLVQAANQSTGTPDLSNPDDQADVYTLAKALVGLRTNNQTLIDQARANIMAAMGTETDGESVAFARNLPPYIVAADLIGLSATQDSQFRAWLVTATQTQVYTDNRTLVRMHEERPNNWGLMAGGARAAAAAYLGNQAELARVAQVLKGWMGDRTSYAGFSYGGPDDDLSWQLDPTKPVGVLPKGTVRDGHNLDGAMPEEMRRGDVYDPNVWPPVYTGYVWEALQGVAVQTEILYRAGYDSYNWQDQAFLRTVQFAYSLGWDAVGDDEWTPWLVDARYGTHYATDAAAQPGKTMGWTNWTCQNLTPAVSSTLSAMAASTVQSLVAETTLAKTATLLESSPEAQPVASPVTDAPAPRHATHGKAVDEVFAGRPLQSRTRSREHTAATEEAHDWRLDSTLQEDLLDSLTSNPQR